MGAEVVVMGNKILVVMMVDIIIIILEVKVDMAVVALMGDEVVVMEVDSKVVTTTIEEVMEINADIKQYYKTQYNEQMKQQLTISIIFSHFVFLSFNVMQTNYLKLILANFLLYKK